MTLPSSGTISLQNVQSEFGGANPISLSEYYRGGPYVIAVSPNSGIPQSGTISLANMYGGRYARPFSVTYLGAGSCASPGSVTPTVSDPRCQIIVIQSRASGSTGLRPGATAIIGGTTGVLIDAHYSTAFDDGVATTITSKLVTDGSTQSLSFPNADGTYYLFQYVGVENLAAAILSTDFVFNTDGGNVGLPRNYVTVNATAGQNTVLFIGINRTSYSGDPTGKLDVYVGSGTAIGFDTNPVTGANTYNFALSPRMLLAFTLDKEVP